MKRKVEFRLHKLYDKISYNEQEQQQYIVKKYVNIIQMKACQMQLI